MEKSKFNFAMVFSLLVLLVYTFITFLGMVYWQNGKIVLPIILALGIFLLVSFCVVVMCKAKATRWKRIGLIGQIIFGCIILATFIFSAAPFTNFLYVLGHEDEVTKEINTVMESAKDLDEKYTSYANKRLDDYKARLNLVSRGKDIRPSEYEELLGIAIGDDDDEKIDRLASSLERKLLPDSLANIKIERENWLLSASNMSVWNVMMPSNIDKINKEVGKWVNNYTGLSTTFYRGEEAESFNYPQFNTSLKNLTDNYVKLHMPSILAIIVSLICFFIMLLPYWMTTGDVAGNESGKLYE